MINKPTRLHRRMEDICQNDTRGKEFVGSLTRGWMTHLTEREVSWRPGKLNPWRGVCICTKVIEHLTKRAVSWRPGILGILKSWCLSPIVVERLVKSAVSRWPGISIQIRGKSGLKVGEPNTLHTLQCASTEALASV
eukprot:1157995-Pelagomonas_calceolata.AAC.6